MHWYVFDNDVRLGSCRRKHQQFHLLCYAIPTLPYHGVGEALSGLSCIRRSFPNSHLFECVSRSTVFPMACSQASFDLSIRDRDDPWDTHFMKGMAQEKRIPDWWAGVTCQNHAVLKVSVSHWISAIILSLLFWGSWQRTRWDHHPAPCWLCPLWERT